MAKGGSEPAGVGLEGQEVPGEYRDAVVAGTANPAHTGTRRASDRGLGESPLRGDAHGGFGGAGRGDGLPATAVPRPGSTLRLACHDEVARSDAGRGRSCRSDQEPSLTIRS